MKQIVIVSDAIAPWHVGGKEERLRQLAADFRNEELELNFATMKWWEGSAPTNHLALCKKYPLYTASGKRATIQAIKFAFSCLKLFRVKADLIEVDQIPFLQIYAVWLVARIRRIPFTVTWHEVWGKEYWQEYSPRIAAIAALIERIAMMLPDQIIAVSNLTADRLKEAGVRQSKITTIEASLDVDNLSHFDTALPGHDLLFAGRLIEHKRVDVLIRAAEIVSKHHPKISFGIVGDGPERESLERLSHSIGLSKNIIFHGELPERSDVIGLMKKSRVFPSASEREGFGLAVGEALALGMQVSVADHPDNAAVDFVINHPRGRVLEENTPDAHAEAILEMLDFEADHSVLSSSISHYRMSEQYESLWKKLIK